MVHILLLLNLLLLHPVAILALSHLVHRVLLLQRFLNIVLKTNVDQLLKVITIIDHLLDQKLTKTLSDDLSGAVATIILLNKNGRGFDYLKIQFVVGVDLLDWIWVSSILHLLISNSHFLHHILLHLSLLLQLPTTLLIELLHFFTPRTSPFQPIIMDLFLRLGRFTGLQPASLFLDPGLLFVLELFGLRFFLGAGFGRLGIFPGSE